MKQIVKKTLWVSSLLLLGVLVSCVPNQVVVGSGARVQKDFRVQEVRHLDMGGHIDVEVKKGPTPRLRVVTWENIMPYVVVERKNDYLSVRCKQGYRYLNAQIKVLIETPDLNSVKLSGNSTLKAYGRFESPNRPFMARVSGASTITRLQVAAPSCDLELSGASEVDCVLACNKLMAQLSGASELDLAVISPKQVTIQGSGASDISMEGKCDDLRVMLSGSSELSAEHFSCFSADVSLSGASETDLGPVREVSYNLSGASSLEVTGSALLKSAKSSGASTFKIK